MFAFPLFGCVAASSSVAWSPADLTGVDFWLQAPPSGDATNGGLLTIVSGAVSDAADAAGTATVMSQATAGRRPVIGSTVDGFSTLDWAYADDVHLEAATGGLSGDVDHSLFALVKITDAAPYYPGVGYGSFLCYGDPVGENSHIGVQNAAGGSWWGGGGASHGLGTGGPSVGKSLDGSWRLLSKVTTSNEEVLCVDGVEVYRGDTSTAPAANKLGAGRWLNNPSYGCSSHQSLGKIWVGEAVSATDIRKVFQWAKGEFPTAFPRTFYCIGDSLTAGYGLGSPTTERWASLVATSIGYREKIHAVTGWTTTDMVNGGSGIAALSKDGLPDIDKCVMLAGTNDLNASASGAATWAAIQGMITTLRTAGVTRIIGLTVPACGALIGAKEVQRQALNALILANAGGEFDTVLDIAAMSCFSDYTNATYYQLDQVHWTAATNALVATAVEAIL